MSESQQGDKHDTFNQIQQLLDLTRVGFKEVSEEIREIRSTNSSNENVVRDVIMSTTLQKEQLQRLVKIIDGNGREGLSSRLLRMENTVGNIQGNMEKLFLEVKDLDKAMKQDKDRVIDKLWGVLKPLIAAAIGAGAVAGTAGLL